MTSPVDPNVDPLSPPVASPAGQASADEEIRQLARVLSPADTLEMSGHKATITAVSLGDGTTPPSVTVDLNGISVPGVALAANYTPTVGDTVVLIKQLNSYVAAFKIATLGSKSDEEEGGWIAASLHASHSTQGAATVMYRRINDHGSWKMQWKGALAYGGNTSLLASALATEYRPSVNRQVGVTRSVVGGESTARIDFATDGTGVFAGLTRTTSDTASSVSSSTDGSHTHALGNSDTRLSGFLSQSGSDLGHAHALGTSGSGGSHNHTTSTTISISVTDPPWVSLDGGEYFL